MGGPENESDDNDRSRFELLLLNLSSERWTNPSLVRVASMCPLFDFCSSMNKWWKTEVFSPQWLKQTMFGACVTVTALRQTVFL